MNNSKTLFLDDAHKIMWAEAGTQFPGEKLLQVIQRAIQDESADRDSAAVYELRRRDLPAAFDHLKKLQSTGRARLHIEVEGDDFREVLRVEASLLDALMQALTLLLDVLVKLLGGWPQKVTDGLAVTLPSPPGSTKQNPEYVPSWKRGGQYQIGRDGLKL